MSNFLHCYYTYMYLHALVPGYTVGEFIFSYAYALTFHKSLFWVPIWAAGVPISQKVGSLLGSYFKALGSLLVFGTVPVIETRS